MVKSMVQAGAIPHFHLCDELDMRAVLALRKAVKEDSVLQGVHLTFLPIMIKVCWLLCLCLGVYSRIHHVSGVSSLCTLQEKTPAAAH